MNKLVHNDWVHVEIRRGTYGLPYAEFLDHDQLTKRPNHDEHAYHIIQTLKPHYDIAEDGNGNKFLGMCLDWGYSKKILRLYMND